VNCHWRAPRTNDRCRTMSRAADRSTEDCRLSGLIILRNRPASPALVQQFGLHLPPNNRTQLAPCVLPSAGCLFLCYPPYPMTSEPRLPARRWQRHTQKQPPGRFIMSKSTGRRGEDDLWTWAVIGFCFGAVTLALWGTLLWHSVDR
jgi:hypothetical protein